MMTPKIEMMATGHHEMGHFVAARVLEFLTGDVHVAINASESPRVLTGSSRIFTEVSGMRTIADIKRYLERRIVVLYAGGLAEDLWLNKTGAVKEEAHSVSTNDKSNKPSENRYADDHAKVRELLNLLRNLRFPDSVLESTKTTSELVQIDDDLVKQAKDLVVRHAGVIANLATRLSNSHQIDGANHYFCISAAALEVLDEVKSLPPWSQMTGAFQSP